MIKICLSCKEEFEPMISKRSKREYKNCLACRLLKIERAKEMKGLSLKEREAIWEINRKNKISANIKFRIYRLINHAKVRAKKENLPFDLDAEELCKTIESVCPITGLVINFSKIQNGSDDTPTLDRIVPERGYVNGNVKIISNRGNWLKGNLNIEICENIINYLKRHSNNSF
jgi:hypothetical protein